MLLPSKKKKGGGGFYNLQTLHRSSLEALLNVCIIQPSQSQISGDLGLLEFVLWSTHLIKTWKHSLEFKGDFNGVLFIWNHFFSSLFQGRKLPPPCLYVGGSYNRYSSFLCVCVSLLNIAKFWWGPLYSYISKQSSLSCCYDMESKTKRILCWIKLCSFTRTLGKALSIKPTSSSLNDWLALHYFISSHRLDPDRRQFVSTARWVYRPQSGYVWERV